MVNTCIHIEKRTREKLKELRITKLETYNEILIRLIEEYNKENMDRIPNPAQIKKPTPAQEIS